MRDDRDYKLDLSSASGATPQQPAASGGSSGAACANSNGPAGRPFISVHF